jgi:hypothetical protein
MGALLPTVGYSPDHAVLCVCVSLHFGALVTNVENRKGILSRSLHSKAEGDVHGEVTPALLLWQTPPHQTPHFRAGSQEPLLSTPTRPGPAIPSLDKCVSNDRLKDTGQKLNFFRFQKRILPGNHPTAPKMQPCPLRKL